ncbi:hypothetical protein [Paenibacillus luteus]|uniref:hypothetical protein n=1 Tax=Paenibacillus luteus TaxID=2545753 RepID=UPI001142B78A|nr:hypothetical protein [Paenibacillus luteus]
MIPLELYSDNFEKEYLKTVSKIIDIPTQKKIVNSCKKFFPNDFFTGSDDEFFKLLITASFEKLKEAEQYINTYSFIEMKKECFYKTSKKKRSNIRSLFKIIHDSYATLANSMEKGMSMRVRIVNSAGLTVCPYCNRDYINNRGGSVSGAQLDHFFSKSEFPVFSVCLYNLVPVCGNCNRIKSAKKLAFASPFDNSINWDEDVRFSYTGNSLKDVQIVLNSKRNCDNNIKAMRINNAYQMHSIEVLELIEKKKMYNSSQNEEFKKVLKQTNLTDLEIKGIIFGPEITNKSMKTRPLSKMMKDLHKELKIY